ncbi:hypothetical protein SAMN04488134_101208 [Amphibacillus marinus]|uniref:Antigen I/II N-terminal domain-containing protein n=1 Tax=Amphibacillus marinus TaxID=872970 RepID=A0A1H8GYJ3_9BACI|nr:hypothetical protein [Amphibacillus marinus]SEN49201.1 hypothetical protein SAMN04488134_101208 [Amphibacillus marinus]
MKRLVALGMFTIVLLLTACGGNDNVEVVLPSSIFGGEEEVALIFEEENEEEGIKELSQNDDGDVVMVITPEYHEEWLQESKQSLEEIISELQENDEFSSIQDVTYSDDFSTFTVLVDYEAYEDSIDSFMVMSIGYTGIFYQIAEGKYPDDFGITIDIEDVASGEVVETINYPEDLDY